MKFEHTITYDAAPEEVYAMLTDASFREKVCEQIDAPSHDVRIEPDGEVVSVTVDQTQRVRKVPAFAAKFVGETVQVLQVERWGSPESADLDLTIPGKPGSLMGTIALDSSGPGTVERISGDLKVGIPIVGGKIEGVLEGVIKSAMEAEERVGRAWLAGER